MSQTKIYTLSEIQRINDSRVAISGHRYTDTFGNVWVGTDYRRLQILSGSTAVWGNISGTLSDQSDLWLTLQSKQDLLVSGTNIKTINGNSLLGSGNISIVGGVQSVTGLNTDNTDPLNPVVEISVDGVTITGDGTPGNPLISVSGGGSVNSVTDDGNGVVTVDNTDPVNPVIEFNGVNVDGTTVTGDGTSGNPLVATGGILKGTASGTDTFTTTITGVAAYTDGDAYLIRFTNGNTTGCTLNINSLGAKTLYRNNDGQLIGGDITAGAEMLCVYNSTANNFQLIGTAPNSLFAYVTNDDSVTITKGMPVYAFSGQGDRLTVKRAYNTTDATSAQTVGLVLSTSIAANQKGLIMMQGLLDGLSILPTATWNDGDPVYLGATAGTITKVKPHAPNHLVYLGFVTTASNGSAGRLYVRVQNGYELDEIHDVKIVTPLNNQGIFYNNSNTLWENKTIISALSGTKAEFDTACSDGNFVFVGDAILNPEGWTVIVKSANQDVTNSATLTNDTDLQFSVVAGGHYMIEMDIVISASNITGDYKNAFFVSAGTMLGTGFMIGPTATGTAQVNIYSSNTVATSTSLVLGTQTANIDLLSSIKIIYSFQASANATLSYQFANNAAAAGRISRTWKGSILKYKRID
jgi:hypothetical protein